ncbi:unnamed protein product [Hyaloperonospora brassicae]|uniref:Uncharacterized protein n=1 Tax=Hyaloperonospora brassicae TaxID=162125 RepID=A0AAV0UYG1_HYABA|nr:unnamed protein product [Hyaloperonospora brassicae]
MERGGLRSQQQEAERVARELMDVKIEAAHLRERLRLRVGGDATAAELEAEAFALQTALGEAQATLKTRETALQTLERKYEQSMRGMLQLDEAWKLSKTQTRAATDALQAVAQQLDDEKRRGDELQRQLEAATGREAMLADRVDQLTLEVAEAARRSCAERQVAKRREMQICELRAELETTRQTFEAQRRAEEGVTRDDVRQLQKQLQAAQEQAAALRGEVHARHDEAAKVEAELRAVKEAEAETKQRLVKLTEEHATLRVHLESAKSVAAESTQRAVEAETENDSMRRGLDERDEVAKEKEQTVRALEQEVLQMQKVVEEELRKKKQAIAETEQRLTRESQEMLQAQEETWSCRERALQLEVAKCEGELARVQAFHIELAELLQMKEGEDTLTGLSQGVEPTMLKALVVQQINKREVLTAALGQMKAKAGAMKRQLRLHSRLETENQTLRAEYEKAKLAMERMASRKGKSCASLPARQVGGEIGSSSPCAKSVGKEIRSGDGEDGPFVKRRLEADEANVTEVRTTPRKAQRTKHVYVASRYMDSASKR